MSAAFEHIQAIAFVRVAIEKRLKAGMKVVCRSTIVTLETAAAPAVLSSRTARRLSTRLMSCASVLGTAQMIGSVGRWSTERDWAGVGVPRRGESSTRRSVVPPLFEGWVRAADCDCWMVTACSTAS